MYDVIILLLTIALIHYACVFYFNLFKKVRAIFNKKSEITVHSRSEAFVVKDEQPAREETERGGENIYE